MKDFFPTPMWLAEALVERHFSKLGPNDFVVEPSCGLGGFLFGIPSVVPAIGVEVDPGLADKARLATGRQILVGSFLEVALPRQPTAIIGNPPFTGGLVDEFLQKAAATLQEGGRAGFLLPCYALRSARRVAGLLERWSILSELLPRSAFCSAMREPLVFAVFSRDRRRLLVGLALFEEEADRLALEQPYRDMLAATSGSAWRAVCALALRRLGGEADLQAIYGELEKNRPYRTAFWREKIRQTLRRGQFRACGEGRYALA